MAPLKNLPGSFAFLISETAHRYEADYVIVDMNPSLSAINQALLITSDFFIVPTAPDNFSTMAVRSLSRVLPRWEAWAARARQLLADASYPPPDHTSKFLGTVIQRFNIRKGKPTKPSREVIDGLSRIVQTQFVAALSEIGMLMDANSYSYDDFCLALIPDFQTLNAAYQTYGIPVFALSDKQLGYVGTVLKQYQQARSRFHRLFSDFADSVVSMTQNG